MRRSTVLMSLAAVAIFASNAVAQAKPSFAGSWILVVDSAAMAQQMAAAEGGGGGGGGRGGRGGGGMGQTFSAMQDDKTLTVTRTQGQNEIKMVYNLDGSESKNVMMGRGGQTEQVSKAAWEGTTLVITRTQATPDGATVTIRQIWALDAAGNLWLENHRDGQAMGAKIQYKKGVPISK